MVGSYSANDLAAILGAVPGAGACTYVLCPSLQGHHC